MIKTAIYFIYSLFVISLFFIPKSQAYKGQIKSVNCKIIGGELNFEFNNVPANKLRFDSEYWPNICTTWQPYAVKLNGQPFDTFKWAYLGCKKINGQYQVRPNYMNAGFFKRNTKGVLNVGVLWSQGDKMAGLEITQENHKGDVLSRIDTDCEVKRVY